MTSCFDISRNAQPFLELPFSNQTVQPSFIYHAEIQNRQQGKDQSVKTLGATLQQLPNFQKEVLNLFLSYLSPTKLCNLHSLTMLGKLQ
jgi:FixJ family two-component response regulator